MFSIVAMRATATASRRLPRFPWFSKPYPFRSTPGSRIAATIGAACTAALVVPLALPPAAPAHAAGDPGQETAAPQAVQSLRLERLSGDGVGLPATSTSSFSLLGVVWPDERASLEGRVEVRARNAGTGKWSGWVTLQTPDDHVPEDGTSEAADPGLNGGTSPLWVGASDGVEVRVRPASGGAAATADLPSGLRVELIDPGPEQDGPDTTQTLPATPTSAAGKYTAPRPSIVTRSRWGADESLRESGFVYTDTIRTAFVHHTASSNGYTCKNADAVIRSIYSYHVLSQGWRDIGYNFLIDRCGTIYEGRAGGVAEPVMGAHTYGHNHNSTGIALLGTYSDTQPSKRARDALAQLTAWKLGRHGVNPRASRDRVSGGGTYAPGTVVRMKTLSGHRDGYATECPGDRLYGELPAVREAAARLQGRKARNVS